MNVCKNCGVELEDDMQICPLCGQPVNAEKITNPAFQQPFSNPGSMTAPQKKFTWEIVSLILLCAIAATLTINFIINKNITWAEYPVAVCLIIFSYVSFFTFWRQQTVIQMLGGLFSSAASILALDASTGGTDWALLPGIPILLSTSILVTLIYFIIKSSKHKGINLLAWAFLDAGLLCLCIDGILSYYQRQTVSLTWSVIVGLSVIPVVLVLLFVYFRLKKGKNLKRTFHV